MTLRKILKIREFTVAIFLVVIFLLVGFINSDFLKYENIMITLKGSIMYIFLAIGMTFVIFIKEIDVSVGSILGISAAVGATLLRDGKSLIIVILATLAVGAVAGLVNGIGVAKLKVPSIVMTLGTMGILRGLMFIYTGGKWIENLPDFFKNASQYEVFGKVNGFVVLSILIMLVVQGYLSKVKNGIYFKAVGDNVEGATLVGINVNKIRISAFVISGISSSIGALIYISQVGFVGNVAGNGAEMIAIAACVLGGVSLTGGIGTVVGATMGAIIISSINTALVFLKVPSYWNNTISGMLLIIIVVSDVLIHRYMSEKARKERLSAKSLNVGGGACE